MTQYEKAPNIFVRIYWAIRFPEYFIFIRKIADDIEGKNAPGEYLYFSRGSAFFFPRKEVRYRFRVERIAD